MKKLVLFSLFFTTYACYAQSYNHGTLWSRLVLNKAINKDINLVTDLMYRRQNDNLNTVANIFDKPFLFSQRIAITYRPKAWQFGAAVGHFKSFPLLGTDQDKLRPANNEWRFITGTEYFRPLGKNIFQWRTQYEYRKFTDRIAGRARTRLALQLPVNDKNRILTTIEGLWSMLPNINTRKFDQSQFSTLLIHQLDPHVDLEGGYRFNYRKRRTSYETDLENVLSVGLIFRY